MFKDCRTLGVPMSDDVRNTIIIGSGPAGYTAGLYSARSNAGAFDVRWLCIRRSTDAYF